MGKGFSSVEGRGFLTLLSVAIGLTQVAAVDSHRGWPRMVEVDVDDEKHFEYALGFAVVRRWADLSRETQQLLFDEATAGDDSLREGLATFLHGSISRPPIRSVNRILKRQLPRDSRFQRFPRWNLRPIWTFSRHSQSAAGRA